MQLRHLRSIKDTLTRDLLEKVAHTFIGSHLDYCNALLNGLPKSNISKRQLVARLLVGRKKFDHVTIVLKSLHRLPLEKIINFKVLLLVYRALHIRLQYI